MKSIFGYDCRMGIDPNREPIYISWIERHYPPGPWWIWWKANARHGLQPEGAD